VADVLQRLIRQDWADGSLSHPLSPDTSFPIPQYADDTLILCKASPDATTCLKKVLDDFASATDLAINFHKSCMIPMHVFPDVTTTMENSLWCPISSFPEPYFGLPLSPTKLPSYTSALSSSPLTFGSLVGARTFCPLGVG
jgi:hypothetical protein